jgi:hypothetical protein
MAAGAWADDIVQDILGGLWNGGDYVIELDRKHSEATIEQPKYRQAETDMTDLEKPCHVSILPRAGLLTARSPQLGGPRQGAEAGALQVEFSLLASVMVG